MKNHDEYALQLIEYSKTIPESSWQQDAIKSELRKINSLKNNHIITSFFEDEVVYPDINMQLAKNIWQIAKGEYDFKIFAHKLKTKRYIIKQM